MLIESLYNKSKYCALDCDLAPGTFLTRYDDQLPLLSGVHGLKDFLCSAHLLESFDGQIYSLKHFNKCKFVHQRTQEDEHYRENPSNHELLTVRGVDCRAFLKMFRGQITVYPTYCLLIVFSIVSLMES